MKASSSSSCRRTHSYDIAYLEPDILVTDADLKGDRELILTHTVRDGIHLNEDDKEEVLKHLRQLWGYDVSMTAVDAKPS